MIVSCFPAHSVASCRYMNCTAVIVLNELDGRLYYADDYGWHRQGDDWSPITLFVEFNGTDQFNFKFKAPADSADPSVLIIHDGDGTITEVDGDDATTVTHTTSYSEAGTYYFYVEGDVLDLTYIDIRNVSFIYGDIAGFGLLLNLTGLYVSGTGIYGDVVKLKTLTSLTLLYFQGTQIYGDVGELETLTLIQYCRGYDSLVHGDISRLNTWTSALLIWFERTSVQFNSIKVVTANGAFILSDNNFTSKMVDNALQSWVNITGKNLALGGNNAPRTSASDAAFAIVDAANTLTVNE